MTDSPRWVPVLVLFVLLGLAYLGMWRGWRRRGRKHDLPPLVASPPVKRLRSPSLESGARYFGTTVSGNWLDRVVARGLGPRSSCRLLLSAEGLDVIGVAGSFRIRADTLLGARHDQGIAGKVVPPHGLLVVTWQHGDLLLDSGFRLSEPDTRGRGSTGRAHEAWVQMISTMATESA